MYAWNRGAEMLERLNKPLFNQRVYFSDLALYLLLNTGYRIAAPMLDDRRSMTVAAIVFGLPSKHGSKLSYPTLRTFVDRKTVEEIGSVMLPT